MSRNENDPPMGLALYGQSHSAFEVVCLISGRQLCEVRMASYYHWVYEGAYMLDSATDGSQEHLMSMALTGLPAVLVFVLVALGSLLRWHSRHGHIV